MDSQSTTPRPTRRGFLSGIGSTALGAALLSGCGSMRVRELSALDSATQWLNTPPLTAAGLHGKVVLVGRSTCRALSLADGRQQLWQVEISRPDDNKLIARGQVRLQNVER